MKSTVLFVVLICFYLNSVAGNACGGLLEGEQGRFRLAHSSDREHPETSSSSCIWILQLHYENNIRFTLDALSDDAHLNLYPEDQLTSCSLNDYTKLNSTQVGSSFEFLGKTLIVVLPSSSASVAFSWHFIATEDKNTSVSIMKNSDYIDSRNGLLEWGQLEAEERVTWGINSNANFHIKWDADVATSCNSSDSCACFYFALFQLTSEGVLSEALKTCGQSSEGKLEGISGSAVVLVKVNSKVEANKVVVSWGSHDGMVTEPPVTELPITDSPVTLAPEPTGLFASTSGGLVALNLQTLEATTLKNEYASGLAINHNLEKVYWSLDSSSSSIMRSNFNGSEKEIIIPATGGYVHTLAIHELSGDFYYSVLNSNAITVCNAFGKNCSAVISSSSLANHVRSIALDSERNVMYWTNFNLESRETSLIRANLDGSNVTIISSQFSTSIVVTITLEQPANDALYWADSDENAIGTIGADGSNKRTLLELEDSPLPFGIQIDDHKIYFGNYNGKTMQSFNMDSGELTTLFNSTGGIHKLALFSAPATQLLPLH